MKENSKGITLITLIITIIVLLILAGVAVSLSANEETVFEKANEAKTIWNEKVEEENEAGNYLVEYKNKYRDVPARWNRETVNDVKTEISEVRGVTKERTAPIPDGYTVSDIAEENTIAGGLVIYEGNEKVNQDTEAKTTRNQYVWIPVDDINDMIMCDGHTSISDCNIVIDEETGKIYCQTHMTIEDAELTNTETKFLCGRLYGSGTNFGQQNPAQYSYNLSYREPAVVTGKENASSYADYLSGTTYDGGSANSITREDGSLVTGTSEILQELKRQFTAMAKSVAIYGGFYVGRYEAGYDNINDDLLCRKDTPVKNILNAANYNASTNLGGAGNWYGIYKKLMYKDTGTVSSIIWGCQWDQVMKFINGKNDGAGNAFNVTESKPERHDNTTGKAATGANINDLVQNIYDLEGNFYEWTATANNVATRVRRGGCYSDITTAAIRDNYHPSTDNYSLDATRQALYIAF